AGELFGCEPFMSEDWYRTEFRRGRIFAGDVEAILARALGPAGDQPLLPSITRRQLRARVALYGIPQLDKEPLKWTLGETEALQRFRDDVPPEVREQVFATRGAFVDGDDERGSVRQLWTACTAAVERLGPAPARPAPPVRLRHRDHVLAAGGADIDDCIHPVLIRFVGAFLDQGLAQWTLDDRQRGLYASFVDTFATALAGLCGAWARSLPELLAAERGRGWSSLESLAASLDALGVDAPEQQE